LEAAKLLELWYLQRDTTDDDAIEGIRKQVSRLEVARQVERQEGRQGKLDNWILKK
jgi:hypothetical protein